MEPASTRHPISDLGHNLVHLLGLSLIAAALSQAQAVAGEVPSHQRIFDAQGRQLIPGGFVTLEKLPYTSEDYRRMTRMGAGFQVIRVPMGLIGAWPETEADPKAIAHFDELVRLGREAGMYTVFKLVNYGAKPRGDAFWEQLWTDSENAQDHLIEGWTRLWVRYKDEPSVFGYDLLNEPTRGNDPNYERIQSEQLLPLLRRMTDVMHEISPDKWALFQPLLRKPNDQPGPGRDPVVPIEEPFGRDRSIYAPHLYQMDPEVIAPMLDDLERQAAISKVPLLLGEWGSPVYSDTDDRPSEQQRYTRIYQLTVNEIDQRSIGGIKPWFCGGQREIPTEKKGRWMTWSIFSDPSPTGKVERKYLTDVIARPRPIVVAGTLERYRNDFENRRFEAILNTDSSLGETEIFIPAERHYPSGFVVELGSSLSLTLHQDSLHLEVLSATNAMDREQARHLSWDKSRQRLVIGKWIGEPRTLALRVSPISRN